MQKKVAHSLQKKLLSGKYSFEGVLVFLMLSLFFLSFSNVKQKQYIFEEGQPAEETIRAPKTVENVQETENKRQLAQEAVAPEYSYHPEILETQLNNVKSLLKLVSTVNDEMLEKYQEKVAKAKVKEKVVEPQVAEKIAALKSKFENADEGMLAFYQSLPETFYEDIFSLSSGEVIQVRDETLSLLEENLSKKIREENLSEVKQDAIFQLQMTDLNTTQQQDVRFLLNKSLVANEFYNEKKTAELKKEAKEAVAPVMIYQGEIIVREGNQMDERVMKKLKLLGMTKKTTSILPVVALGMMIFFQSLLLWFLGKNNTKEKKVWLVSFYGSVMIISVALMNILKLFQTEQLNFIPLLFPVAFAPLILTIFCSRRLGSLAAIFQTLFIYFIYFDSVGTTYLNVLGVVYLFEGILATMINRNRLSKQVGKAFVWIIVLPFLFNLMMLIYQGLSVFTYTSFLTLLCSTIGSGLSYLLSVGLHPYIEYLITDDSDIVLNELSNPNHPLLKELLEKVPGTYHHSMMVANLSANAVAEIGGRTLLTRVACYYHDIGKLKQPNFFVENLPIGGDNPHNYLLPQDSKKIIFSHVTEGVKILTEYQMPQMVIDICQQHHGTTLMKFFYVTAKKKDPKVTEEEFRYPGPKPQTREAAVVSIADSCEAAVRAMDNPSFETIQNFVHNLIIGRLTDGQLDECGLTMKELKMIEKSIISGLGSTFHSRIKYPTLREEEKS